MILQYIKASGTSTDTSITLSDRKLWEWEGSKDYAFEKYGYRQLKYSCAACIHGHRTLRCVHFTKPLVLIKERGQHSSGKANNFLSPVIDPAVALRINSIHLPRCPSNPEITCLACEDTENCTCSDSMKTIIIDMDYIPLKIVHNGLHIVLNIKADMVAPYLGSALDRHPYRDAQLRAAGRFSKEAAEHYWEIDDRVANNIADIKKNVVEIGGFSCADAKAAKTVLTKELEMTLSEQAVTNYQAILNLLGPIVTPTKLSEKAKKGLKKRNLLKNGTSKSTVNPKFPSSRQAHASYSLHVQPQTGHALAVTGVRTASKTVDFGNPLGLPKSQPETVQEQEQTFRFDHFGDNAGSSSYGLQTSGDKGFYQDDSLSGTDFFYGQVESLEEAALRELNTPVFASGQSYQQQQQSYSSQAGSSQEHRNGGQYQRLAQANASVASVRIVDPRSKSSTGNYSELFDDNFLEQQEAKFRSIIPGGIDSVNNYGLDHTQANQTQNQRSGGSDLENESEEYVLPDQTDSEFDIDAIFEGLQYSHDH